MTSLEAFLAALVIHSGFLAVINLNDRLFAALNIRSELLDALNIHNMLLATLLYPENNAELLVKDFLLHICYHSLPTCLCLLSPC